MSTVSKVFSAAGQTSALLLLKKGQSATYAVTTVFVATVVLQKSTDDQNWVAVATVTDATASGTILAPDQDTKYRWLCSDYTSDSPTVALADRTDTLREIVNADGTVVFKVTDAGIESPAASGAVAATTISASGQITSTVADGTAPLVITSTTVVPNLNAATVAGKTMAIPGAIGGTTPAAITGTDIVANDSLTSAGMFRLTAIENAITAAPGGTQAGATALLSTRTVHRVSVCATNADSVKLPTAVAGEVHIVRNDGAAILQVFGAGTSTINDVATATGVAVGAGKSAIFVCITGGAAGTWYMILSA